MPNTTLSYLPSLDTHVRSDYPTTSYSTHEYMQVSYSDTTRYGLMQFALSGIANNSYIVSGSLAVSPYSGVTTTVRACRITSAWSSSTTYNTKPSFTTTGASAAVAMTAGSTSRYTLDVTAIVRSWIHDGTANHGILLQATAGPNIYIRSSDYSVAADKPKLTVVYYDPAFSVNINGAWKHVVATFVNINGTWRRVIGTSANINGTWRHG